MRPRGERSPSRPRIVAATTLAVAGALAWFASSAGRDGRRGAGERAAATSPVPSGSSTDETPGRAFRERPSSDIRPTEREAPIDDGQLPAGASSAREPDPPADLAQVLDLLASADPRGRFEGVRLLAELRPGEAVPEILAFLAATRDDERVLLQRLAAVALLGELEGVSTGPELCALYEQGDAGIRRAAACALEKQGDPALVQREILALQADLGHPDGALRARAAEEIGELASPLVIPVLLPLLEDPNSEVRAQAIDGLWRADDPLVRHEIERLLDDPVERVRERARRALRALAAGQAAGGPGGAGRGR